MEAKHRYRLLIYFAALILCLSVCFANAETLHGMTPVAERQAAVPEAVVSQTIIFESTHGRAAFMPALRQSFIPPSTVETAEAHVVPQSVLQQVNEANRAHHFWHGSAKRRAGLVLSHQASASSSVTKDVRHMDNAGQSE